MTDIKSLYKSLGFVEKIRLRKKIARILGKHGKDGLQHKIPIGDTKKSVRSIVKTLIFKPEQALTLENYNMAIILYKVKRTISKAFLTRYLMHIIFDCFYWIKPEHEKILSGLIRATEKNKPFVTPTRRPSTRLQDEYVIRLFELYIEWSEHEKTEYVEYISSHTKLRDMFETFLYKEWVEKSQQYDPALSTYYQYGAELMSRPASQYRYETKEHFLFTSLVRCDHKPFMEIFKDISQIRNWPSSDRKLISEIVDDMLWFSNYKPPYGDLMSSIASVLSADPVALTKFFIIATDREFLGKSTGGNLWGYFFSHFNISVDILQLDEDYIRFLLEKENNTTLWFLFEKSRKIGDQILEFMSMKELERILQEMHPCHHVDFHRILADRHFSKFLGLFRRYQLDFHILERLKIKVGLNPEEDMDLDVVIRNLIEDKIDVGKTLECLANGSLPRRAIPQAEKLLYNYLGQVKNLGTLCEYFCGTARPTLKKMASIPFQILNDNADLCKYIIKRTWDLLKSRPRKKGNWPLNQTIQQAILLLPKPLPQQ